MAAVIAEEAAVVDIVEAVIPVEAIPVEAVAVEPVTPVAVPAVVLDANAIKVADNLSDFFYRYLECSMYRLIHRTFVLTI